MIKTIIRAMYSAFISIVLIAIFLAGWTCFAFITQPTKSGEIINVIQDMYESQKSVIIDVIDLSKLLIQDKSETISSEKDNLLKESDSVLMTDLESKSLVDEPLNYEDNGDNPLGIVVEPSLADVSERKLPELGLGLLDNEQNEIMMDDMDIN